MKRIKLFILIFVILLCSPVFFACKNLEPKNLYKKLSAPTDVVLDEVTFDLSWSAVEDADFYYVDINGKAHQSSQTQLNISAFVAGSGEYIIKVGASSFSSKILDSDFSESISLSKKEKLPVPTIVFDETEFTVSWQPIADVVYYTLVVNNIEFVTTETSFNLLEQTIFSNVINETGNNTFSVYCTATSDYLNSDMSNQITIDYSTL